MLAAALAACGGGGGGGGAGGQATPSAALTLGGTAATGAAIAGATVQAKCVGGTGTATTAADGTFLVTLAAGNLPCVLKVSAPDGDLDSIAAGAGATAKANITPLTQLIVANLAGKDPANYFLTFNATDVNAITTPALSSDAWVIQGAIGPWPQPRTSRTCSQPRRRKS